MVRTALRISRKICLAETEATMTSNNNKKGEKKQQPFHINTQKLKDMQERFEMNRKKETWKNWGGDSLIFQWNHERRSNKISKTKEGQSVLTKEGQEIKQIENKGEKTEREMKQRVKIEYTA